MSRYRKIDPRIWNDAKFCSLSDSGKLIFFMLLTHPSMTALGAMRATLPGLAAEMGWTAEAFAEAFAEASRKGMAEHDERACFVGLKNFLRYNPPESPNVVKAWVGAVDMLPECRLKNTVLQRAQAYAEGMSVAFGKAFAEAFPKAMPNQEQEQEQEQEKSFSDPNGSLVPGKPGTGKHPPCQQAEIISAYHEILPELPPVNDWPDVSATHLRNQWRRSAKHQDLTWWRELFGYVRKSPFLMGSKTDFQASLGWIVKPANFAKVVNGNYDNRGRG